MSPTRREFLARAGGLALAAALPGSSPSPSPEAEPRRPRVDFHVHLFGVGDGGTGCVLSPRQRRHPSFLYLRRLLGLRENGRMDADYLDLLVSLIRSSSLDRAVLLAQDCRYDSAGRPDLERTSFFVPNRYVLEVCARFPDLLIPCVSVNPRRRDAVDEVERCAAAGARVLKVHPPTQDVDPADPRFRPFFRRCAERGILVMVHTGGEHAAETVGHLFSDPARLAPALEEGCTVIAAHSGMGAFFEDFDFLPGLVELVRRHERLFCDTAVLASVPRWRNLPRLLRTPEVLDRLVHASDFPFPSNALVFWNRLAPGRLFPLLAERNLLERDYRLKRALGLPVEVFERGARLLGLG